MSKHHPQMECATTVQCVLLRLKSESVSKDDVSASWLLVL